MQVKRPAGDRKLRTELLDRRQDAILCQCIVDGLQDPLSGLGGTPVCLRHHYPHPFRSHYSGSLRETQRSQIHDEK